ncbi:penicillin-binding protein activator [Caldilinea sp.]|uniref:ABC transporter substrate-binding protein n=1 Tax=Caldilinea sp. TaxID=2293560 RepID=UPI002C1FB5A8|nr:penicillin-binding protein activator [Anaerolineales bacterium]HQY91047.1 penicillin-binding protein activator [Caldilinea sp.]HRA64806.1 penicillin-binding protein activator [Caldilinea sp.]
MRRTSWILLAVLLLSLVLSACTAVAPAGDAAGPQTYTLGIALPYTGSLGSFGTDFQKGVELAVEQMNAQLEAAGASVRFQTASADTEGTPDGALKAVQTVVQTSGAKVVIGPLTTSEVLGAKQFVDENDVVLVAPASSGLPGALAGDNIFRVMYPPDTYSARAFAEIATRRGYENIVALVVDDPFGNGMIDVFTKIFQEKGGQEVSVVKYAPEPADLSGEASKLSAEVERLSASGETAVFAVAFLGDAQKLLQQAVTDPALGSVDWLGVENLVNPDILGDPAHAEFLAKVGLTSVSFGDAQNPNTQPFLDAFAAKYESEPGPFTNYAYDAANIAMLTMLSAGNDGKAVKSMLPFVSGHYIGTAFQAFLDENGDQAIAYYTIFQLNPEGAEFVEVGSYDGQTDTVTLEE